MKRPCKEALERWRPRAAQIRSRGLLRFILREAILLGVPWSVFMAGVNYFTMETSSVPFVSPSVHPAIAWFIYTLPFGVLAGVLWALWMWRTFQKKNWFLEEDAAAPPAV